MRRALATLLLVKVAVAQPFSEPPPIDPAVQLHLSVADKRREFHIGEIIPIKLAFHSRVRERYEVDQAQYDRSGRMNYEHFGVTPSDGAVDPLAEYYRSGTHMGGGLRGFAFLTGKPWSIRLNLNEWVLSQEEQAALLDHRWNEVKGPALLPLLKRYAQNQSDFSQIAG